MRRFSIAGIAALGLALGACSTPEDTGTDAGTNTPDGGSPPSSINIKVSGVALSHPLNAAVAAMAGGTAPAMKDSTSVAVAVVDPIKTMMNPAYPPLAAGALTTAEANCPAAAGGGCMWNFDTVNIKDATLGLVVMLRDSSATPKWITTATGIAGASTVTALKANPTPGIAGAKTFAVSVATEAALVGFVNALRSTTDAAGSLVAKGFMIGSVLDATQNPVADATVASSSADFDIYYPTPDMTTNPPTVTNGTKTSATGMFLVVPKVGKTGGTSTLTVTPATGNPYPGTMAGTNAGSAFILFLVPG